MTKSNKQQEWLSIDSAPTDGTIFIAKKGSQIARTARGQYYVKFPHEPGGPTFKDEWNQIQPDSIYPWSPTHWIPMPILNQ